MTAGELVEQPGNRVNVSVVNTNSGTVSGVVEVLDSDGSAPSGTGATSLPFQISGYSSHQFNDVLANIHSRFGSGDTAVAAAGVPDTGTAASPAWPPGKRRARRL
jgi:hypothetical protein